MADKAMSRLRSRRELLKTGGCMAGAGLLSGLLPKGALARAFAPPSAFRAQAAQPAPQAGGPAGSPFGPDFVVNMRKQMGAVPVETLKLRDDIYMLYGPGGKMVALNGADGKVLVDSSFVTAAPKVLDALNAMGKAPLKVLVNTHWHFDHTDGNQAMHEAGALIVAHENTRKRLASPQTMPAFGLHFDASPAAALPQQTFTGDTALYFGNEQIHLGYFSPAHTDTDIYVHYANGNVLHMGDIWFNGNYPLIDAGTLGNINGMITASEHGVRLADADTKIVPGHGPLGDRGGLKEYHDMLATVRDRVKKQKDAGKSLAEVTAAKPTADLDAKWGNGSIKPDFFVNLVYSTL
jgi:glyoxylase-like metal-dependent hydrolase (beta-lactamase superfamily II)